MSFYDIDTAHPQDLIVSYILDLTRQGCFLPYGDYHIVGEWLERVEGNTDELLLVLSEVLPKYFAVNSLKQGRFRSLAGVRKLVLSRLESRAMRRG